MFESALSAAQGDAEGALRSAGSLTRELRKAKAAAATGQVREYRRALDAWQGCWMSFPTAVMGVPGRRSTSTRPRTWRPEITRKNCWTWRRSVAWRCSRRTSGCFAIPPSCAWCPGDSVVEIDRRRERRLRPSVLIGLLAAAQQRPPKFRAGQFLESLASGYELVVARAGKRPDAVVRLTDIWSVLTLLPGQGKEYTRPEFARDLYLLDQDGVRQTKGGRLLRWHASSGTRTAGVLTTVARTGQQQRYWGVSFTGRAPR